MTPAFSQAASQLEPYLRLGKLDTEAEPGLANRYGIRSIPTLILISKGREVDRQSGAMPANAIVGWARQALAAA
jgi:thioredoxin 2